MPTVEPTDKDATGVTTNPSGSSSSSSSQYMYVYSLSAVSASLTSESPVCVADIVKMFEDHYGGLQRLSEVRFVYVHSQNMLHSDDS